MGKPTLLKDSGASGSFSRSKLYKYCALLFMKLRRFLKQLKFTNKK